MKKRQKKPQKMGPSSSRRSVFFSLLRIFIKRFLIKGKNKVARRTYFFSLIINH